ncbi:MAG: OmpA family protein [Bacteroidales bacterium]|nr:OmpA family protein [Bacteroidales bacterium]
MKKLVITLALMLAAGTMFAQEVEKGSKQRWNHFETNRFIDNWEITVGAGVQTFYNIPNEDNGAKLNPEGFAKDLTLAIEASVGKWINPIVGLRLGFQGLQFTNYFAPISDPAMESTEEGTKNTVNYWTIHGDVMINLTNWICRYKADRFYNAIIYAGLGYGRSSLADKDYNNRINEDAHNNEWLMPVGLINRFRLCDAWTFNITLSDLVVANRFDNARGNELNRYDEAAGNSDFSNILSVTGGFTWKIPTKRDFNSYAPIDKAAYDNRISALERDLQNANDKNAEYQRQIDRYKKQLSDKERELQEALRKAAQNTPAMANDDVTLSIFFPIDKAEVSDKNIVNIKYLAEVIKSSNKTYTITGYADAATGTEEHNMELSQKRAENVYNALIEAGVDKSQLKVDYKGCSVQPFDKDYLNRVAIIK